MHEIVDRLSNIATRCRKAALINKLTKNSPHGKFFVGIASYLIARSPPARALGTPVSQLSLFTATFTLSGNPPHKADDVLIARPPFLTEARKYQLSLLHR